MVDVPLREHLEAQIRALDRLFEQQIVAIKEATALALKTIPTKEDMDRRLSEVEKNQSYASGKSAVFGALGGGVVSVIAALVGYLIGR